MQYKKCLSFALKRGLSPERNGIEIMDYYFKLMELEEAISKLEEQQKQTNELLRRQNVLLKAMLDELTPKRPKEDSTRTYEEVEQIIKSYQNNKNNA